MAEKRWITLQSFIWGKWVTSKKVNIDFDNGNIKNGNIEFTIDFFNINSKNGVKRGPLWGGGWLLMMIGDAMTPFDPVLTPFDPVLVSMLPFSKLNSM